MPLDSLSNVRFRLKLHSGSKTSQQQPIDLVPVSATYTSLALSLSVLGRASW